MYREIYNRIRNNFYSLLKKIIKIKVLTNLTLVLMLKFNNEKKRANIELKKIHQMPQNFR